MLSMKQFSVQEVIGFEISVVNSTTLHAHSVTSSFVSLGIQKNESSDSDSFLTSTSFSFLISFSFFISFNDETFSSVLSSSEFQRKDKSEMIFVHGDTGDETSFLGEVIRRDTTC